MTTTTARGIKKRARSQVPNAGTLGELARQAAEMLETAAPWGGGASFQDLARKLKAAAHQAALLATDDEPAPLLTVRQAAAYLGGVKERTVWRWIKRGTLRPVRLEGRTLFRRADLNRAIERAWAVDHARANGNGNGHAAGEAVR